jgi:hypothetical protein
LYVEFQADKHTKYYTTDISTPPVSSILLVDASGLAIDDYAINTSVRINKRKQPTPIYVELPLAAHDFVIAADAPKAQVSSTTKLVPK